MFRHFKEKSILSPEIAFCQEIVSVMPAYTKHIFKQISSIEMLGDYTSCFRILILAAFTFYKHDHYKGIMDAQWEPG